MKGKLFVIEGLDASGKETQSELLFKRLVKEGQNIRKVTYPNYQSPSSALVKMYLNGDFGENPDDVNAYVASTFYAADRYASYKTEYENFYRHGGIILCDRYTTSNMVHQASKLKTLEEKEKFLGWLENLEYTIYGIPSPVQVFFLDVVPDVSLSLIEGRNNKFTAHKKKDIHESAKDYLYRTYDCAQYLISRYGWERIACTRAGELRSVEDIGEEVYLRLKKYL